MRLRASFQGRCESGGIFILGSGQYKRPVLEVGYVKVFNRGFLHRGGSEGPHEAGGTARRAMVQKMVESLGGRLEVFYFAFGEKDVYLIFDVPDNPCSSRSKR